MTSATLNPAYVWDCDECGVENFTRAIVLEMSPEELQSLRDEHNVEPWVEGEFMMMPTSVTCRECGAEFDTEPNFETE